MNRRIATIRFENKIPNSTNFQSFTSPTAASDRSFTAFRQWVPAMCVTSAQPLVMDRNCYSSNLPWNKSKINSSSFRKLPAIIDRFVSFYFSPSWIRFYGLNIRTNFVHYHLFMVLSLIAYCVCSYISVIKVTGLLSAIRYNSLTYRLVAIRVRRLQHNGQEVTISNIDEIVKLHRKAFE